jgi:hypothetical protein
MKILSLWIPCQRLIDFDDNFDTNTHENTQPLDTLPKAD